MAALGFRTHRRDDRPRRPASTRRDGRRPLEGARARPLADPARRRDPDDGRTARCTQDRRTTGSTRRSTQLIALAPPALERRRAGRRSSCRSATSTAPSARCSARGHRGATAARACPTTRSTSRSPARPARASAPSCRAASRCALEGDANDYVGKGLSGGRIIVDPPTHAPLRRRGEHHRRQRRRSTAPPAARSSSAAWSASGSACATRGATAVVEGVGDHGCEYMTGGRVVVLGPTGPQLRRRHERRRRLRATTRTARSRARCNHEMVDLEALDDDDDVEFAARD